MGFDLPIHVSCRLSIEETDRPCRAARQLLLCTFLVCLRLLFVFPSLFLSKPVSYRIGSTCIHTRAIIPPTPLCSASALPEASARAKRGLDLLRAPIIPTIHIARTYISALTPPSSPKSIQSTQSIKLRDPYLKPWPTPPGGPPPRRRGTCRSCTRGRRARRSRAAWRSRCRPRGRTRGPAWGS